DHPPGGLGIGLALARRLVEMHGGSISARSAGIGLGSEFVVQLPLDQDDAETPAASTDSQPAPIGNLHRILIADDNRDALESLEMLLMLEGHTVFTALDGEQALAIAAEQRPEIALLDIGMAKLDGYAVARAIREQEWGQGLTLV